MILGRSFLYVFVMLLPCVGCIHSDGKSSQEKILWVLIAMRS